MTSPLLNLRRRSLCLALPALAALALPACSGESSNAASAPSGEQTFGIPVSQAVTGAAIKEHGRGFTVGQLMAVNEVFVFFDPKCPHCAMFWLESESLRKKIKFTWLPVAVMGRGSAGAGAEILAAEDKVQAMTVHATKIVVAMRVGQRPAFPATDEGSREHLDQIARNTRLLKSFGAESVPYVVAVNAEGKTVLNKAGAQPEALTTALGLPATQP